MMKINQRISVMELFYSGRWRKSKIKVELLNVKIVEECQRVVMLIKASYAYTIQQFSSISGTNYSI